MPSNNSPRNPRNNPYVIEGWAVNFHRSAAGVIWRWRTELILIVLAVTAYLRLAAAITALWAAITLTAALAIALVVPTPGDTWSATPGA